MTKDRVIHGFHAISASMRANQGSVHTIYYDESRHDQRLHRLLDQAIQKGIKVIEVSSERIDRLASTSRHQGVVALCKQINSSGSIFELLDSINHSALLLVLDCIVDPHNLGACLRVADAAAVDAVIAPRDKSVGINATVERVSCGAARSVPYITVTNLSRCLNDLKKAGIWIIGTDDSESVSIYQTDLTQHVALVFGSENKGMRRLTKDSCDMVVSLPMLGSVNSLNVSVAVGICLYEALRQRNI